MDVGSIAVLLALGAAVGLVAGLLGIGGGMLMVPFTTMVLLANAFPSEHVVKVAIATSLATILFTSLSSVRAHHARGAVRWDIVRLLAPGILVGSFVGGSLASRMDDRPLAMLFALFLGFSALQMLRNAKPQATRQLPDGAGLFTAGALIGGLAGMVGAGGGFASVPFMTRCNVKIHNAVATSAALGFPVALAGTASYMANGWQLGLPSGTIGFVYLPALAAIAVASILTAPLGARAAHALPTGQLRRLFALVLFALAAYMMWKAFH